MKKAITKISLPMAYSRGSMGLYVIVFLLVGMLLSVFLFFPQFLSIQSGINKITCREIRKKVQIAVEEHDANNTKTIMIPGQPVDLDYLKEKGYLAEVQLCPEKGKYFFGPNGRIICSFHDKDKN